MKKTICMLGLFYLGINLLQAQTNRVGINTETPEASLDIKEIPVNTIPGIAQGVSLPNFSNDDRSTFKNVKEGTIIYNTSKKCLEIYTGINNNYDWYCIGMANIPPTHINNIEIIDYQNPILYQNRNGFNIPYTGKAFGSYGGARITKSVKEYDTSSVIDITLVIPAGIFSGTDGGNIPAYFERISGGLNNTGIPYKINFPVKVEGLPPFEINVTLNGTRPY